MAVAWRGSKPEAVGQGRIELLGRSATWSMTASTLRLVPVVAGRRLPPVDQRRGRCRRVAQPAEEGGARIAGRHHDGRLDHGAVGELDAPHPLALAEDGGDLRAGAHGAARGLERAAHRVGDGAAAADRPADRGDVLHGVGQTRRGPCRACRGTGPTRPGRPRPRAPSPRPRGRSPAGRRRRCAGSSAGGGARRGPAARRRGAGRRRAWASRWPARPGARPPASRPRGSGGSPRPRRDR